MKRLLIRPGAIGDFLLSLPAMEHLRAGHTEVWAASRNLPLARFADRARTISSTGLDLLGLPEVEPPRTLLAELGSFDEIVSWYGANRPEFREAVVGLPFRFLAALPPEDSGLHAADFYLRQVGGAGEAIPGLDCPTGDGGFVAIHPFSGSPKKNWPLDRYKKVARRLSLPVKWIVEPGSTPPEGVGVEPPLDDLYQLACLLAKARLYIGNDSGITHLAAAAGAPVLALFGPTNPAVWAPRGPNVHVITAKGNTVHFGGGAGDRLVSPALATRNGQATDSDGLPHPAGSDWAKVNSIAAQGKAMETIGLEEVLAAAQTLTG